MDDWQKKFNLNRDKFDPFEGQLSNQQHRPKQQQSYTNSSEQQCRLKIGCTLYRSIDANGFGGTQTITVPIGTVTEQFSSIDFVYNPIPQQCILLENQASVLDLSKQNNTIKMYKVRSALNGTFYVLEASISNLGRTFLQHPSQTNSSILKG